MARLIGRVWAALISFWNQKVTINLACQAEQSWLWVLVQTAKGIGDDGLWCIAKRHGILYLLDVGSKTTSFSSALST